MTQVYFAHDQATWIGDSIPGPKSVFHFFAVKVSRRRTAALCGAEMLVTTLPVGNLADLAFDSRRWPICRPCAVAAGFARFFAGPHARLTSWPRLPAEVALLAPDGFLERGPVRLPNGTLGKPLRRVGDEDLEWVVEFAPGVAITLPKAWLTAAGPAPR